MLRLENVASTRKDTSVGSKVLLSKAKPPLGPLPMPYPNSERSFNNEPMLFLSNSIPY